MRVRVERDRERGGERKAVQKCRSRERVWEREREREREKEREKYRYILFSNKNNVTLSWWILANQKCYSQKAHQKMTLIKSQWDSSLEIEGLIIYQSETDTKAIRRLMWIR